VVVFVASGCDYMGALRDWSSVCSSMQFICYQMLFLAVRFFKESTSEAHLRRNAWLQLFIDLLTATQKHTRSASQPSHANKIRNPKQPPKNAECEKKIYIIIPSPSL
jgi:hypothetical protein